VGGYSGGAGVYATGAPEMSYNSQVVAVQMPVPAGYPVPAFGQPVAASTVEA